MLKNKESFFKWKWELNSLMQKKTSEIWFPIGAEKSKDMCVLFNFNLWRRKWTLVSFCDSLVASFNENSPLLIQGEANKETKDKKKTLLTFSESSYLRLYGNRIQN